MTRFVDQEGSMYESRRPKQVMVSPGTNQLTTKQDLTATAKGAMRRKQTLLGSNLTQDDSSEYEEEKLPPFVGNVESQL